MEPHVEQTDQPPAHTGLEPLRANGPGDRRLVRRCLVPLAIRDPAVQADRVQSRFGGPAGGEGPGANLLAGFAGTHGKLQEHAAGGVQSDDLGPVRRHEHVHRVALDPRAFPAVRSHQLDDRLPGQGDPPELPRGRVERQGGLVRRRFAQPPVARGGGANADAPEQLHRLERVLAFPEVRGRRLGDDGQIAGADARPPLEAHVAVGVGEGDVRGVDVDRGPFRVAGQPHAGGAVEGDDAPPAVLNDVVPERLQAGAGHGRHPAAIAHGDDVPGFAVAGVAGPNGQAAGVGHAHVAAHREVALPLLDRQLRGAHREAVPVPARRHRHGDAAEEPHRPVCVGRLPRGREPEDHDLAVAPDELDAGALAHRLGVRPVDGAGLRRVPALAHAGDEEGREEGQPGGDAEPGRTLPSDGPTAPARAAGDPRGGRRRGLSRFAGGARNRGRVGSGRLRPIALVIHDHHCIELARRRQSGGARGTVRVCVSHPAGGTAIPGRAEGRVTVGRLPGRSPAIPGRAEGRGTAAERPPSRRGHPRARGGAQRTDVVRTVTGTTLPRAQRRNRRKPAVSGLQLATCSGVDDWRGCGRRWG